MRKIALLALLLTFALSGCASVPSGAVKCPALPPVPASLQTPSNAESKVRAILFDSPESGTPKSAPTKHS